MSPPSHRYPHVDAATANPAVNLAVDPPVRRRTNLAMVRRRIDRAGQLPLGHKVALMILVSVFCGVVIGVVAGSSYHPWPLVGTTTVVLAILLLASHAWITEPIVHFAHRLDVLARGRHHSALKAMPTGRADELGRFARATSVLALAAIRHRHEVNRLRRTLDSLVAQETKRATRQLKRLALRDPLTGLGNRRLMDEQLQPLLDTCRRQHTDLICLLIDLDNFKHVNDTLSHAAGDELLELVGSLIAGSVRACDLVIRLGGDEFVIVIPDASVQRAAALGANLRDLLRHQVTTVHPQGPHANLSIGVASFKRDQCADAEQLLAVADKNLYAAKRAGKGCTYGT